MSFRNRCIISGANGLIQLSVPIEAGRDQKKLTKDVRVSATEGWQKQHWKSIVSSYNRSPWFEFYWDELAALYQKPFVFLIDWNMACFEWATNKLNLTQLAIGQTQEFLASYDPLNNMDQRNKLLPKNYTAHAVMAYRQVFGERFGFLPNLSILDLLFCEGKNAVAHLHV